MICICCGQEIGKNQGVVFLFGKDLIPYPVCRSCMEKAQNDITVCLTEDYTPGIIEEEL